MVEYIYDINMPKGRDRMEKDKKVAKNNSSSGENLYAVLSYLWVLCLIPVFVKKENEFIKFHARQGLMLFMVEIAVGIVGIVPILGSVVHTLGIIVCGLVSLVAIVQVLMGKKWKIPVVSEWSEKLNI